MVYRGLAQESVAYFNDIGKYRLAKLKQNVHLLKAVEIKLNFSVNCIRVITVVTV